jgi:UDP-2-acetamido-2-deoxy-ribo-hexuluronate aminotransferase
MQFIDLKKQYDRIKPSVNNKISAILERCSFIMGPEIEELEQQLAKYVGVRHCITCTSGTDALLLPLLAYGIGPGDAVLTTPFTFFATAEVISFVGAVPIFVDIDPITFNIDKEKLKNAIHDFKHGISPASGVSTGLRLKAIIPVDLFGLPADYDELNAIAKENDLKVIEDAAQSFGASYKGRKTCSLSEIAATSFFPAKPLGCYGDGGAVFTNNDAIADIIRSLRIHGKGKDQYDNVRIGINGRFDTLQAAVLLAKMDIFDDELQKRQIVARNYTDRINANIFTPTIPEGYFSAWAQYSIRSAKRLEIMQRLKEQQIPTMIYYPKPLHLLKAFENLGYVKNSMPVSEAISQDIFSLPMHPYLDETDQQKIIDVINQIK